MQSGFVKFRKKQMCITLINSLIWGFSIGLFTFGALLCVSKLTQNSLHILVYVLPTIFAFASATIIAYLCFYEKDKKLAKRLDKEFDLNDRTQTMIEFQDEHTDMIRLQREDAQAHLDELPLAKFRWRGFWICLVAIVCAVAVFVTGLVIPKREGQGGGGIPPGESTTEFEITNEQKNKLATLIKNVNESKAEDTVKTAIVTELKSLQIQLDEFKSADELYAELVEVIESVDDFVEKHNTYKRIYNGIRWITDVNTDEESTSDNELETVKIFAVGIGKNELPKTVDELKSAFQNEEESSEMLLTGIKNFVSELQGRFAKVQENAEDPLMIAITQLIKDVETVTLLDPTTYSYNKVLSNVEIAISDSVKPLTTALIQQLDNREVTNSTIESLIYIFQLPTEQIPDWGGVDLEGLENDEDGDDSFEPGDDFFEDETKYPSNEKIYDYYTKIICEYGKVFENEEHVYNYKKAFNDLINEGVKNGTITPEVEKMLRAYLDTLSGGDANEDEPKEDI